MAEFIAITFQVEGIAQRRGFEMDFEELWRFRSRDVRGAQPHL